MTGHLGYETHDPPCVGSGNSPQLHHPKTALTDVGAVDLAVPATATGLLAITVERWWTGEKLLPSGAKG